MSADVAASVVAPALPFRAADVLAVARAWADAQQLGPVAEVKVLITAADGILTVLAQSPPSEADRA
jgi:hypothetical protein